MSIFIRVLTMNLAASYKLINEVLLKALESITSYDLIVY